MISVITILSIICAVVGLSFLLAKTTLSLRVCNFRFTASLTIGPVAVHYSGQENRLGIGLGRWRHYFKPSKAKPKKEKKPKPQVPPARAAKKTGLSWATKWRLVKALLIFVGNILSRVQYEKGQFDLQPVIANPALAGMSYGWGQALAGMWPGLGKMFRYTPQYVSGTGRVSGTLILSVKNRHIAGQTMRLLVNLPIIELVKYLIRRKKR